MVAIKARKESGLALGGGNCGSAAILLTDTAAQLCAALCLPGIGTFVAVGSHVGATCATHEQPVDATADKAA